MIRARGAGDRDDIAMTRGEYDALRDSDPRPWPEPYRNLIDAIEDAPDLEWMQSAACKGVTGMFYPEDRDRSNFTAAKKLCRSCPVRAECLEAGMDEVYGVWGGLSPRERSRLRRTRQDKRVHPPEVRDEAMMLARSGLSDAKVGARLGVHVRTVQTWRRMAGMQKDNHGRLVA